MTCIILQVKVKALLINIFDLDIDSNDSLDYEQVTGAADLTADLTENQPPPCSTPQPLLRRKYLHRWLEQISNHIFEDYPVHYWTQLLYLHFTFCLCIFSPCLLMYLPFFSTYSLPLGVCLCFYLSLSPRLFVCRAALPPHCCLPFLLVGHIHSPLPFSSGLQHYRLPK